ncbi:long-chain-fatty-acid--CoA ligase [Deinococcus yavapaiensis]|uniref:Long-chain acyl-CoA synthetase n=1 Tax=Deinococcus yavapaiensis KR-236 TaxID=694435 RepID=A0A318SMI1_9DEIO|nr:long-chain fatty acid--CoA ligase [Deinococcus yavapaiensis]PYE55883.1 long-chain acyl-CoA synthetase [Deinococcus yavapaiensis KR-236]
MSHPWYQHYEEGVPRDFQAVAEPIYAALRRSAERFPDRLAVEFVGARFTYKELWSRVNRFAHALQDLGVRQGDRVSIMLPNTPQFVIAFYGAALAGAIVVNTSPLYVSRELEHQLVDSGSETLVMLDAFYPRYEEIQDKVPVKRVIVTGLQDALPFPKNVLYPLKARKDGTFVKVKARGSVYDWRALLAKSGGQPLPIKVHPQEVALLQYTGGTTGTPKGAMLTHVNLASNTAQCRAWMPGLKDGEEIMLAAIPFFHVYGMTTAMNLGISIAASLVLLPNPRDIKMLLSAIDQHRPSVFPGVPTLYNAINQHPDITRYDLTSIKACISGSAPLPAETARKFRELTGGANLVEGYGLTEASPVTHVNPVHGDQRDGIGLPLPGVDSRVVNEAGEEAAQGEIGELWLSGPNVMSGYWRRPQESAKTLCEKDGRTWLLTGDMAVMDHGGYFRIVDRKKDLIIAGGYNIYPREVEEVLYRHPAVLEAAVIGVPDEYRGESVKAFVVFKPGQSATPEELKTLCRRELSPYKVPRSFEVRAELPKTAVGKILRRRLHDEEIAKVGVGT